MPLSRKEIEYVANLSRIELSSEEMEKFASQLSSILDYINKLKELDVQNQAPMTHVFDIKNVMRKDSVKNSISSEQALQSAPAKDKKYFKAPKIVD